MKQGPGAGPRQEAWPPGPSPSGRPQRCPALPREDQARPHTARSVHRTILLPPGGERREAERVHTHSAWHYAGLYSLTFSSQRKNLARKLTDDFKIYLNKWGGQQRLLDNCIIGLRPRCFGDFPLILSPALKIQAVQPRHGAGVCLCG